MAHCWLHSSSCIICFSRCFNFSSCALFSSLSNSLFSSLWNLEVPMAASFLASGSASGHCSLSICSLFLSLAEPLVWLSPGLQGLPHLFWQRKICHLPIAASPCQPTTPTWSHHLCPSLPRCLPMSPMSPMSPWDAFHLLLAGPHFLLSPFLSQVGGFFLGGCSFLVSCCPCTGLGSDFLAGRSLGGDFLAGVPFTLLPCPSLGGDFFAGSFSGSPSPPQSGASMSMLGILVLPFAPQTATSCCTIQQLCGIAHGLLDLGAC